MIFVFSPVAEIVYIFGSPERKTVVVGDKLRRVFFLRANSRNHTQIRQQMSSNTTYRPTQPPNLLQSVPPEILTLIWSYVAVSAPKTFFSLFRLNIFFKDFIDKNRIGILQYISEHNDNNSKDGSSVYVDYIKRRFPDISEYDGDLPRVNYLINWAVDGCYDIDWLYCATALGSTKVTTLIPKCKHLLTPNRIVGLLAFAYTAKKANPDLRIIIYRALQDNGISLRSLPLKFKLMLLRELTLVRLRNHDAFREQMLMVLSNGFHISLQEWMSIGFDRLGFFSLEDFSDGTDGGTDGFLHGLRQGRNSYPLRSRLSLQFRVDFKSVHLWQSMFLQLLHNTPKEAHFETRKLFFKSALLAALKYRLGKPLVDSALKNYADGMPQDVIMEVLALARATEDLVSSLLTLNYDFGFIVSVIFSGPKDSYKENTDLMKALSDIIFKRYSSFRNYFVNHIITHGPFEAGCYVVPDVRKLDKESLEDYPYEYVTLALVRNEIDVLEWLLKNEDMYLVRFMIRECVSRNLVDRLKWMKTRGFSPYVELYIQDFLGAMRDMANNLGYVVMAKFLDKWRRRDKRLDLLHGDEDVPMMDCEL